MFGSGQTAPNGGTRSGLYSGGERMFWLPDSMPTSQVAYRGAPQTIRVMGKAALEDARHFETRKLAEKTCESLSSKDYASEYLALYYLLLQRCRYMRDPRRVELVRAPYVISKQIADGRCPSIDCDDMSTWLAAALLSVGGQPEFVTVAFANLFFGGQRQYSHVFVRVKEPRSGRYVILDPVAAERTPQMLRRIVAAATWPIEG